ncbi:MAG: hypothetical protein L0Z50_03910 [Verrucomicrobiales bacterium]|nr:hypothetical protein [Verrucomicrobiales bacterium]
MKTFLALFLAAVALPADAQEPKQAVLPAKLVVALKPDKNPDAMLTEKRSLEAFLREKLQRPAFSSEGRA